MIDLSTCPPAEEQTAAESELEENELFAKFAKALAHPARVAIIRMLLKTEGCIVGDIVDELPLAQSTVSQHLKKLKEAGVIRGEVSGPKVCYCIEPSSIVLFKAMVAAL